MHPMWRRVLSLVCRAQRLLTVIAPAAAPAMTAASLPFVRLAVLFPDIGGSPRREEKRPAAFTTSCPRRANIVTSPLCSYRPWPGLACQS
ncbi:hypothetical protein B0T11DRAFT_285794, partial [Plectosphaerella cucumerina]